MVTNLLFPHLIPRTKATMRKDREYQCRRVWEKNRRIGVSRKLRGEKIKKLKQKKKSEGNTLA